MMCAWSEVRSINLHNISIENSKCVMYRSIAYEPGASVAPHHSSAPAASVTSNKGTIPCTQMRSGFEKGF
jgi:hypothetical protein